MVFGSNYGQDSLMDDSYGVLSSSMSMSQQAPISVSCLSALVRSFILNLTRTVIEITMALEYTGHDVNDIEDEILELERRLNDAKERLRHAQPSHSISRPSCQYTTPHVSTNLLTQRSITPTLNTFSPAPLRLGSPIGLIRL